MIPVSVIIPAWNLWSYTRECLDSLAMHTPHEDAEIIVVDNGSSDDTLETLLPYGSRLFGENFKRVRLEKNEGFAVGCNQGARAARGELFLFLNNDTIVTPNWLPPLVDAFTDGSLGAVGPLLLYPDNSVQHCGIFFDPLLRAGHLYENLPADHPAVVKKRRLQAITGAALMLRQDIFKSLGGFCEEYKNGYEDIDLCSQITRLGYRLSVEAKSRVYHHTSKTPGRFDQEAANIELASKRIAPFITPDLHRFAIADGYELKLWPNGIFRPYTDLDPDQRTNMKVKNRADALSVCLKKEPLWRDGWQELVKISLEAGNNDRTMAYARKAFDFFPDPEIVKLLEEAESKKGSFTAEDKSALQALTDFSSPLSARQSANMSARLKKTRRIAEDERDKLLAASIEKWLQELKGFSCSRRPE